MRGKLEGVVLIGQNLRITPADAGKTMSSLSAASKRWDHPRGCGENRLSNGSSCWRRGSPPRMRGKRLRVALDAVGQGITPADAGKTNILGVIELEDEDHPRGCGENGIGDSAIFMKAGSPPRMRGKQVFEFVTVRFFRITPADAGKTLRVFGFKLLDEDHPRGCGENWDCLQS